MSGKRRKTAAGAIKRQALSQGQLRRLRTAHTYYRDRRFREAETICRSLLEVRRDQPAVLELLGSIALKKGKFAEAIACYEKVIERRPRAANAHSNLGKALKFHGRADEAIESYRRAIEIEPDDFAANCNLGNLFFTLGRLAEAAECLNRALAITPNDATAHNSLGGVLRARGEIADARAAFQRAVELSPDYAEAHNNLGVVCQDLGDGENVHTHFRKAIELKPGFAMAHNNIGRWLLQNSRLDEAVAAHERAIALRPDDGVGHGGLANALKTQGKLDEAVIAYRRAIELNPTDAFAYSDLGTVFQEVGNAEEAVACYEKAVALKPDFASALHHLAHMKNYRANDPQIGVIQTLLEKPDIASEDRGLLLFALSVIHDRSCLYDEAFGYLSEANRIFRRRIDYDPTENARLIDRIIKTFDQAEFADRGNIGHGSDRPIFIIGMPRSGKTRVENVLGVHPRVHVARETYQLDRIVSHLPERLGGNRPFPECVDALGPTLAKELGESYVAKLLERSPDAVRITNTRPDNFKYLGLIRLLLPRSRIIHCTRDPLDNGYYCFVRNYPTQPFAFDLEELGAYFLQYRRLMDHWRKVLDIPVLEVRYERLVENPTEVGREIFSFCDLDWDTAFPAASRPGAATRGSDDASFPVRFHKREIGGSRNYEAHLQPLKRLLETAS